MIAPDLGMHIKERDQSGFRMPCPLSRCHSRTRSSRNALTSFLTLSVSFRRVPIVR